MMFGSTDLTRRPEGEGLERYDPEPGSSRRRRPYDDLFARHLDLAPLRSRRRGLVRCPFHRDRTPSLSVDLDAAIFNCFGCGAHGGWKRFAELVGETIPAWNSFRSA